MTDDQFLCPWCQVDVREGIDLEALDDQSQYEDHPTMPLVKVGECPHCTQPIRIHLWIDTIEKGELGDLEE